MGLDRRMSRRRALQAATAATLPLVLPARIWGRDEQVKASERIAVGIIGCGKMARDYHFSELLRFDDVQVVAVCDVDTNRRNDGLQRVAKAYEGREGRGGCQGYNDFRELLARPDIDAVCIATPDHWHAIPAILACQAGKDVYCEKPLTLTLAESRLCIEAARKHERVFQVGSQQRSNVFGPFREAAEFIRSGRLGKIHRVTVGVGGPSVPCDLPGEALEPGLDWNLWLGPAPERPYSATLSPRGVHNHFPAWRNYREYSGGGHSDIGAHHYDIAQWALNLDHTGPVKIVPPTDPKAISGVRFIYADGLEIEHGGPSGCVFHGEQGTLHIDRGVLESDPAEIVKTPLGAQEVHLPVSPGHHRDWLNCIRSRQQPIAHVEAGARTAALIHLGNLAYAQQKTLEWSPERWEFTNPADAPLLDRPRRDPWQLPRV